MITLFAAPDSWQASETPAISARTASSIPLLSSPILMTMSISRAPSRMARRASWALTSAVAAPNGKPITEATATSVAAQVLRRATDPGRVDADGREAMLLRLRAQRVDLGRGRVRPQQRVVDVAREVARDVVRLAVIRDARGAAGDHVADLRGAARRAGAGAGEAQIAGLHGAGATGAERSQHLAGDRLDEVGACVRGLGHRARSSPGDFM